MSDYQRAVIAEYAAQATSRIASLEPREAGMKSAIERSTLGPTYLAELAGIQAELKTLRAWLSNPSL